MLSLKSACCVTIYNKNTIFATFFKEGPINKMVDLNILILESKIAIRNIYKSDNVYFMAIGTGMIKVSETYSFSKFIV